MYSTALRPWLIWLRGGIRLVGCACWLAFAGAASLAAATPLRAEGDAERYDAWTNASLPVPAMDVAEVHAGERITLHWRSLEGAAEELELVFSIDDGRHYDVRVSPELSGGECRYVWRVPNVGVHRARVRLRARIGGREVSGPAGRPFRIVSNPVHTPGLWVYRHGEWWEDSSGEPFEFPGLSTPPRSPSLRSDDGGQPSAVTIRAPEPAPPAPLGTLDRRVASTPPDTAAPPSALPRSFRPMRE